MKNTTKILIGLFAVLFAFSACKKDDFTGHSQLNAVDGLTLSVSGLNAGYNLVEKDTTYTFDVTLSDAQIVDITIYISMIGGDATEGADFEFDHSITIPAFSTKGTAAISVFADELIEGVETFKLQIGDYRTTNADITPVEVEFTIGNLTDDDFAVDMSWDTDALSAIGIDLSPTDAVDLRMLILDDSKGAIIAVEDGGSFETYAAWDTLADGTYYIATDIYSTVNAGQFNAPITLDLMLEFNQTGKVNGDMLSFPAVMTNQFVCPSYRVQLAKVVKSGSSYTYESMIETPQSILSGDWFGVDVDDPTGGFHQYPSQVEVELGCDLMISGLGFGWMTDFWGEVIIAGGSAVITVDETAKTVDIASQYYMTTTYNGAVQDDYLIDGTGTYDDSGTYPTMTIQYEMTNYGQGWAQWCFDNGYMASNKFVANLTLDPNGKWNVVSNKPIPDNKKPVH